MDRRQLVGEAQVADHCLEHVGGRGADAAVVEVDHGAIGVEGPLDLAPVGLVIGRSDRVGAGQPVGGPGDVAEGSLPEHREGDTGSDKGMHEIAARGHDGSGLEGN